MSSSFLKSGMISAMEQRIEILPGLHTWVNIAGDLGSGVPLVLVHGGPGYPSDYLSGLDALAQPNRPVIRYDQIGCGRSDPLDDRSKWTVQTFIDELEVLRSHLGVETMHLLGHSWGGWVVLEYALAHHDRLSSLIVASSCASMPNFIHETRRLITTLPPESQQAITRAESSGDYSHDNYRAAKKAWAKRYLCRATPYPARLALADKHMNAAIYTHMWGPSEFSCTGILQDWDVSDRLGEITVPTLLTSGSHDEFTPVLQEQMRGAITGSRWIQFADSAHLAMVEEPNRYLQEIDDFLTSASGGAFTNSVK